MGVAPCRHLLLAAVRKRDGNVTHIRRNFSVAWGAVDLQHFARDYTVVCMKPMLLASSCLRVTIARSDCCAEPDQFLLWLDRIAQRQLAERERAIAEIRDKAAADQRREFVKESCWKFWAVFLPMPGR